MADSNRFTLTDKEFYAKLNGLAGNILLSKEEMNEILDSFAIFNDTYSAEEAEEFNDHDMFYDIPPTIIEAFAKIFYQKYWKTEYFIYEGSVILPNSNGMYQLTESTEYQEIKYAYFDGHIRLMLVSLIKHRLRLVDASYNMERLNALLLQYLTNQERTYDLLQEHFSKMSRDKTRKRDVRMRFLLYLLEDFHYYRSNYLSNDQNGFNGIYNHETAEDFYDAFLEALRVLNEKIYPATKPDPFVIAFRNGCYDMHFGQFRDAKLEERMVIRFDHALNYQNMLATIIQRDLYKTKVLTPTHDYLCDDIINERPVLVTNRAPAYQTVLRIIMCLLYENELDVKFDEYEFVYYLRQLHKALAKREAKEKFVLLRQSGYRAGGYEEELWARGIR